MIIASIKLKSKHIIVAVFVVLSLALSVKIAYDGVYESAAMGIQNEEEIKSFVTAANWQITGDARVKEVWIPSVFSDVYNGYNNLQKLQGFDLEKYAGETVKIYTFEVTNHPEVKQNVFANVLVFDGKIIGADITQADVNGFIQPLI